MMKIHLTFFVLLIGTFVEFGFGDALTTKQAGNSSEALTTVQYSTTTGKDKNVGSTAAAVITKPWFGETRSTKETMGCDWPDDFEKRYNFCAKNALNINSDDATSRANNLFGQGILNKEIMDSLLKCGSGGTNCNMTVDQKHLENQIKYWWSNIGALASFKTCLKSNIEGVVRMCNPDSQVSQVMSGMAGLYINALDVIFETYSGSAELNETDHCSRIVAESVHVTVAMYVNTQYYWKNSILCWEVTSKSPCSSLCKKFATVLQCVAHSCPQMSKALPKFGIFQWYFSDPKSAQKTCAINGTDNVCPSDKLPISLSHNENVNATKAQRLFDSMKTKYNEIKTQIEHSLHVPFYIFLIITLSSFAVFIIIVVLICMWFNGALGGKKTRVIRYAKLLNNDNKLRVNIDETKSLTRDFDDIE